MAVGDIITAARFNLLQGRIANILGTGSGSTGYGQSLVSTQASVNTLIDASDLNAVFTDMSAARIHQIGTVPSQIAQVSVGDIIAENTSTEPNGNIKGFSDYESLMTTIENDRYIIAGTQSTTTVGINSVRTTEWNGSLLHEGRVTFNDANHARYFFNSGGELRVVANISGGSGAKTTDWASMLSNMGTIKMNYTQTTATGTGSGSSIGFYDLTSSYQTIFTKSGSGIYAENLYSVQARQATSNSVDLRIYFQDLDPTAADIDDPAYPPTDENINGRLTSTISMLRATGSYVSVVSPAFSNLNTL